MLGSFGNVSLHLNSVIVFFFKISDFHSIETKIIAFCANVAFYDIFRRANLQLGT